ncbi:MAG: PD-(D/E)XK nuclease family protein, partial [Bacteroidota bacterium]
DRNDADTEEEPLLFLSPGYADRFVEVFKKLKNRRHPITQIWLNEPLDLLPCHFQRLFKILAETAAQPSLLQLNENHLLQPAPKTDLQKFQQKLAARQPENPKTLKQSALCDGSLLLIQAKRAGDAASYLAKLLRLNAAFQPTCLIPETNRTLDMALIQEGLPSLGIQSASLARPTLQILKLVTVFLWEPIDPFKILEFVSLAVKPLPDELATQIAKQIARVPGLHGDGWFAMVARYFENLEASQPQTKVAEQRRQYNFWFERRRFSMDRAAAKGDVIEIFNYLREWSFKTFDEGNGENHSLIVLSEQAKRIVELLRALPETELTYLELERIVRTIYEPSPVVFQEREAGGLPFVMHPSAVIGEVGELLWWNFVQVEPPHFFSRWYQLERAFFASLEIILDTPEQENARELWQRTRPVLLAKNRLLLVLPETILGEEAPPHPLLGDLLATFSNLDEITLNIDTEAGKTNFERFFILPQKLPVEVRRLGKPKPFLHLRNLDKLRREHETLTSLEALFYYPYQWFFRHKIKLGKSSILSVAKDNTLMGNLAHRVFEKLFQEDIHGMSKPDFEHWMDTETRPLLNREGATLLMYGREPERIAFLNKMKYAAWSLICHIRENGWQVRQTEMSLEGIFPKVNPEGNRERSEVFEAQTQVKAIADLVLERAGELTVVDIKWRGGTSRETVLRNEEDLQLVLYSRLAAGEGEWAHTGYFTIDKGKLVCRNNLAFKGISPVAPGEDHREINERILQKMEATWHWRMEQLSKGQIEIRCEQTRRDIEEAYSAAGQGSQLLEILEMKQEDARWDDYKTLINLLE